MRERLIVAFVALTTLAVALYGIPRAYSLADLVHNQEVRKIERSLDLIEVIVERRVAGGSDITEELLAPMLHEAERLEYVAADRTVRAGAVGAPAGSDITVTRAVDGGGRLTLTRAGSWVERQISRAIFPLVALGLALVCLSAALGFVAARILARPFQDLAARATALGDGRFDVVVPHYRVPEAEQIGTALRESAARLDDLLARERQFTANASHQLRTPLTALRLTLEDLTLWPQTAPEVAAELHRTLGEIDRLNGALSEMLDLARGRAATSEEARLADVLDSAVRRWDGHDHGRRVLPPAADPGEVTVPAGPVGQILDVLVANAYAHGAGDIALAGRDDGHHVTVQVSDAGPRPAGQDVFGRGVSREGSPGAGIGLAVARDLAQSLGGRLTLGPEERTTFTLRLPKRA